MQWAITNIDRLRTVLVIIGAALSLLNLTLGPAPFATRVISVLSIGVVAPFMFYGMRWMLRLQIRQHGLRRWITYSATFFFYFFFVGAIANFAVLLVNIGQRTPFALTVIAPAVFSYAAADTIRRAGHECSSKQQAG